MSSLSLYESLILTKESNVYYVHGVWGVLGERKVFHE